MNKLLRIIWTNWIHLPGFYVSTYFGIILLQLLGVDGSQHDSWGSTFFVNLLTIPLLFFTYGLIMLLAFYLVLLILDLIAFEFTNLKVIDVLLMEWIVIIPPFIYWAFKYDYWLWLILCVSFLVTQLIRRKRIDKLLRMK